MTKRPPITPDLFDFVPEKAVNPIEVAFWKFHAENPEVFVLFCRFAGDLIRRGYTHFSSDAILHRVRWETAITTTEQQVVDGQRLKLNDHYTAYYARLWMRGHPQYPEFFRTRELKAGEVSDALEAA